jgi:hypothetical protein
MLKLLERNVTNVEDYLAVLAAPKAVVPSFLNSVATDSSLYYSKLHEVQRLRGGVYLNDGAIATSDLTNDGRHETAEDRKSWHLMLLNDRREVTGCIWYLEHREPHFDALRISKSALARDGAWSTRLRGTVDADIAQAHREQIRYAEVGGWAVSPQSRLTDCLLLILGTYALSQILGGAYVLATATVRHSSAEILRRLGGSRMQCDGQEIPSYYDPRYGCAMELLRFDTRRPAARFVRMVDTLKEAFASLPVMATGARVIESSRHASYRPAASAAGFDRYRQRSVA